MSVHTHANTPLASRNTCLAPCQAHSDCSINVSCISKNSVCVCVCTYIYLFIYLFIYLSKSWLFNTFNKKYMSQIRPLHGSLCLFWELEQHKHDVWSGNRSLTSNARHCGKASAALSHLHFKAIQPYFPVSDEKTQPSVRETKRLAQDHLETRWQVSDPNAFCMWSHCFLPALCAQLCRVYIRLPGHTQRTGSVYPTAEAERPHSSNPSGFSPHPPWYVAVQLKAAV